MKPRLAITLGDLNGIGPEITAKAFQDPEMLAHCRPVIVGSARALENYARPGDAVSDAIRVTDPEVVSLQDGTLYVLEPPGAAIPGVEPGKVDANAGRFAFQCVELAARLALAGDVDAIVTCPVSKTALNMGGYPYAGHTEFLAELAGVKDYRMMLVADKLRAVHVTTHLAMRDAIDLVTSDRVLVTIRLAHEAMVRLGIDRPRIAVAGLNPHAGEGTLFGTEERDEIMPAVELARADGIDASAPLPPDTVFLQMAQGKYDAVVAMYHDQGHIGLKLVGFDKAVNVTLGLPFIRTSVGHGTAFDIAGKGAANPSSLIEAIKLATLMASNRK